MNGEHVWSPEIEDEEHLDSPSPDSFDGSQPLHDLIVRHPVALVDRRHIPVIGLLRQVEDVAGLGTGKPGGSQNFRRHLYDVLSSGEGEASGSEKRLEPSENRPGSRSAQLLVNDGVDEGLKRGKPSWAMLDRADLLNQPRHYRVGAEVVYGAFVQS